MTLWMTLFNKTAKFGDLHYQTPLTKNEEKKKNKNRVFRQQTYVTRAPTHHLFCKDKQNICRAGHVAKQTVGGRKSEEKMFGI